MIRSYTAYTFEIDDVDIAAEEVKSCLDLDNTMLKNTVGIIACNYEFVLSGAVKAICESLPFDVIGSVTTAQAVNAAEGAMILTLMMLTSDDAVFKTCLTETLKGEFSETIGKTYRDAAETLSGTPSLIFTLAPFMVENSGDAYIKIFSDIAAGIPCFGTMAVDDTSNFENSFTIYNGEHYRDKMAMALIYGDISPRFYIASISEDKILKDSVLITSSEGHILKEVNDKPVIEYFDKLGLANASETSYAMTSLPFMLDYNDGTPPVSRVFISLNKDNHAVCAGAMPEGSNMSIGVFDKSDVLMTTGKAVESAVSGQPVSNILIYSCISRNMSLSGDMLAELEVVKDKIGDKLQFMMSYSGGEFCPTQIGDNKAVNRFHNNTFILCAF